MHVYLMFLFLRATMENITDYVAVVKEFSVKLYYEITDKVLYPKVLLPLSGICFVYYFFIRRTEGKKDPVMLKEPCHPDQPYTGSEESHMKTVRI